MGRSVVSFALQEFDLEPTENGWIAFWNALYGNIIIYRLASTNTQTTRTDIIIVI